MRQIEMDGFKRISKQAAKKLYERGGTVYFCPVNFRPVSMWFSAVPVSKEVHAEPDAKFESRVNAFEYYNCSCSETGTYAAFYVKSEEAV